MKRCDYCGHDVGIDHVSAPDQIGVMHYSKITCAEFLKADVEKLHQESKEDFVKTEEQLTALIAERDAALLQVREVTAHRDRLRDMLNDVRALAFNDQSLAVLILRRIDPVEGEVAEKPKDSPLPICTAQVGCFGQCGKLTPCEDHPVMDVALCDCGAGDGNDVGHLPECKGWGRRP